MQSHWTLARYHILVINPRIIYDLVCHDRSARFFYIIVQVSIHTCTLVLNFKPALLLGGSMGKGVLGLLCEKYFACYVCCLCDPIGRQSQCQVN